MNDVVFLSLIFLEIKVAFYLLSSSLDSLKVSKRSIFSSFNE